jgi:hypothetical protein
MCNTTHIFQIGSLALRFAVSGCSGVRLLQSSVVGKAFQLADSTLNRPIHSFNFILGTKNTVNSSLCSVEGLLVNSEFETMWKEVFVA